MAKHTLGTPSNASVWSVLESEWGELIRSSPALALPNRVDRLEVRCAKLWATQAKDGVWEQLWPGPHKLKNLNDEIQDYEASRGAKVHELFHATGLSIGPRPPDPGFSDPPSLAVFAFRIFVFEKLVKAFPQAFDGDPIFRWSIRRPSTDDEMVVAYQDLAGVYKNACHLMAGVGGKLEDIDDLDRLVQEIQRSKKVKLPCVLALGDAQAFGEKRIKGEDVAKAAGQPIDSSRVKAALAYLGRRGVLGNNYRHGDRKPGYFLTPKGRRIFEDFLHRQP